MNVKTNELTGKVLVRYSVIVWNNAGIRTEEPAGNTIEEAKALAKQRRTLANRTVKIGQAGTALYHWCRSIHLNRNHWVQRATADEWFN